MAQNTLPRQPGALLVLTGKCEAGLTTYATPLNITQITAASLAADAGALSTAMGDFNATRANRTAAHAALQAASAAAKTFLSHGRNVLAAHWGNDSSNLSRRKLEQPLPQLFRPTREVREPLIKIEQPPGGIRRTRFPPRVERLQLLRRLRGECFQ